MLCSTSEFIVAQMFAHVRDVGDNIGRSHTSAGRRQQYEDVQAYVCTTAAALAGHSGLSTTLVGYPVATHVGKVSDVHE